MFVGFTNIGSGYRALGRNGQLAAESLETMPAKHIVESQVYYNLLLSAYYLQKNYPGQYERLAQYFPATFTKLDDHIENHINEKAGIFDSPFVSYSAQFKQGINWTKAGEIGIIVRSRLPKHGVVQTFPYNTNELLPFSRCFHPQEAEVLIAGAVSPMAIEKVIICKKNPPTEPFYPKRVLLTLRRIINDGDIYIEVNDYTMSQAFQKMYLYNPDSKGNPFQQISEHPINPSDEDLYIKPY